MKFGGGGVACPPTGGSKFIIRIFAKKSSDFVQLSEPDCILLLPQTSGAPVCVLSHSTGRRATTRKSFCLYECE